MEAQDDRAPARIDWLSVGGPVQPWVDLGLNVTDGGDVPLPGTGVRVAGEGEAGLQGWVVSGADPSVDAIDGLPVVHAPSPGSATSAGSGLPTAPEPGAGAVHHALGVLSIDHVVVTTDDLDRTCRAIAGALDAPRKRVRDLGKIRQGFHRVGPKRDHGLIVEVVERPDAPTGQASLWGFVLIVADLDAACQHLGSELVSEPRDAVQPGRRIATVRTAAGVGLPIALMSPDP
jgi:hypothetical protein